MADVFEEVEEELRSARYVSLARKGWPYAAALVVVALLITLGVWGYNSHQVSEEAKASVIYGQGVDAFANGDLEGADRKFASLSASAPAGYRSLSLMQQAAVRVAKNKPDEAVRLLDQAAKVAPNDIIGDAARLKAAYLLMDTRPLAEIEARLNPLAAEKHPYRLIAREALGMARLQGGKLKDAQGDFAILSLAQDVSEAARTRAQAAMALIQSGSAASLPAAVKASAAMPSLPQVPGNQAPSPDAAATAAQAGAAQ